MTGQEVAFKECRFTRSGINRYEIIRNYSIGNSIKLCDIDYENELQIVQSQETLQTAN